MCAKTTPWPSKALSASRPICGKHCFYHSCAKSVVHSPVQDQGIYGGQCDTTVFVQQYISKVHWLFPLCTTAPSRLIQRHLCRYTTHRWSIDLRCLISSFDFLQSRDTVRPQPEKYTFTNRNPCISSEITVFENHRKSLIQHIASEARELRLHFEWTKVN